MKRRQNTKNPWQDHYARKAKKDDFPARSVYKLMEIQAKFHLIKPASAVLDLGCAPGAWIKYAAQITGPGGRVVGVDLKPVAIPLPPYVKTHTADIFESDACWGGADENRFDIVLSDMAPNTTGIKTVDAARSERLCRRALEIALNRLVPGGAFVCKIFQGEDFQPFIADVAAAFATRKIVKPDSSRKKSVEIYIVGIHRKTGGSHVRAQQMVDHQA